MSQLEIQTLLNKKVHTTGRKFVNQLTNVSHQIENSNSIADIDLKSWNQMKQSLLKLDKWHNVMKGGAVDNNPLEEYKQTADDFDALSTEIISKSKELIDELKTLNTNKARTIAKTDDLNLKLEQKKKTLKEMKELAQQCDEEEPEVLVDQSTIPTLKALDLTIDQQPLTDIEELFKNLAEHINKIKTTLVNLNTEVKKIYDYTS